MNANEKVREMMVKYSYDDALKTAQQCLWMSESSVRFTYWIEVLNGIKNYEIKSKNTRNR